MEGMDLRFSSDSRNLIDRPFVDSMPTNIATAASLYQEGMQNKENRSYKIAKAFFERCLNKDPLFINEWQHLQNYITVAISMIQLCSIAHKALQIDTYHPATNYYAGVTYHARGDLINALEKLGWAARSFQFRSTAYALMAGIQLQLENREFAEHYVNQSLNYNRFNFNALQVLTILNKNPEGPPWLIAILKPSPCLTP